MTATPQSRCRNEDLGFPRVDPHDQAFCLTFRRFQQQIDHLQSLHPEGCRGGLSKALRGWRRGGPQERQQDAQGLGAGGGMVDDSV